MERVQLDENTFLDIDTDKQVIWARHTAITHQTEVTIKIPFGRIEEFFKKPKENS